MRSISGEQKSRRALVGRGAGSLTMQGNIGSIRGLGFILFLKLGITGMHSFIVLLFIICHIVS